ncbi:hypothetical protein N566_20830 [Streptomycetaceae bacterium MP113-05]|nr:hypothetical protein N566_20830 [Streptomycetaceae bacterium MP113-05]
MSSSTAHATLRYTTLRLGVFLGCLLLVAVLAYAGVLPEGIGRSNPLWILLLGMVLSAPLSYVLLRRQRDAMSEQLAGGVDRAQAKLSANRSMEDDAA